MLSSGFQGQASQPSARVRGARTHGLRVASRAPVLGARRGGAGRRVAARGHGAPPSRKTRSTLVDLRAAGERASGSQWQARAVPSLRRQPARFRRRRPRPRPGGNAPPTPALPWRGAATQHCHHPLPAPPAPECRGVRRGATHVTKEATRRRVDGDATGAAQAGAVAGTGARTERRRSVWRAGSAAPSVCSKSSRGRHCPMRAAHIESALQPVVPNPPITIY